MSNIYFNSAKIINEVLNGRSMKEYCSKVKSLSKTEYALANETLKFKCIIEDIFKKLEINPTQFANNYGLFLVLCYEMLFGKKKIQGGGSLKKSIIELKHKMELALENILIERNCDVSELLSDDLKIIDQLPFYVRINTAKISIEEGFEYINNAFPSANQDKLIPAIVTLPSDSRYFSQDSYVKDGRFIVQDKSSCFPSQILFNEWDGHGTFIDACAAPGNKTSHLAALVKSHPTKDKLHTKYIFAFDKSEQRCKTLQSRMKLLDCDDIIEVKNKDFISIDTNSEKYRNVRSILLDPSCSGSGISRSIERHIKNSNDAVGDPSQTEKRTLQLRAFQIKALKKALSFPSVVRVSYSTCSRDHAENESVIDEVINSEKYKNDWELKSPYGFDDWKHRGDYLPELHSLSRDQCQKVIRCSEDDETSGFFVALLVRKNPIDFSLNIKSIPARDEASKLINKSFDLSISEPITTKRQKRLLSDESNKPQINLFAKKFKISKTSLKKFGKKRK